jgi:phage baseplate assembly protein W
MTSLDVITEEDRFKGLAGPITRGVGGLFSTATTSEIIKASFNMIFSTRPGERVMLPEFGSRMQELLFQPNDTVLKALASQVVRDSILRWEPRVTVTNVGIEPRGSRLFVSVSYVLNLSRTEDTVTLVFRRHEQEFA